MLNKESAHNHQGETPKHVLQIITRPTLQAANIAWPRGIQMWLFYEATFFTGLLTIHNRSVTEIVVTAKKAILSLFPSRKQPKRKLGSRVLGGRWTS